MDGVPSEVTSGLIDLSELDLADLEKLDNPVLASSLAKIRDELERSEGAVEGFQSSL